MIIHIDTANQIHNSWYKDTCIGLLCEEENTFFSIKIPHQMKLKIKTKFSPHYPETIIIANLQSFLLFQLISNKEDFFRDKNITKTSICPDIQPIKLYMNSIEKCFVFHGKKELFCKMRFKVKKNTEKSKAHPKIRKVYQGKRKVNYVFKIEDLERFITYFAKQNFKKVEESNQIPKPSKVISN